jgi:NADH-quinone oxidoreductase subunit M
MPVILAQAAAPSGVPGNPGFPWLTVITFLPLAGAVVMVGFPPTRAPLQRWWALVVTVATLGLSLGMLTAYSTNAPGFQLVDRAAWVSSLNFTYLLGVDGISLFMVLLTAFLMPAAVLVSWRIERETKYFLIAFLVLETAVIGSFLALDLLLFFLFFEALLFPMYLIIGGWGSERRVYAAIKFFLFTMAGSAFLLVAILFLYFAAASHVGHTTFDFTLLKGVSLPATTARWLFLGFFVAFAVKVPLFPLHTWLPDAHTEAPTAGSLILAAVLLKVGAYGLIRFNLGLFPEASTHFRAFVSILALIGIVYGAVVALIQTDIKRLVAYSSVSHLGFVVLGTFAFTVQGMSGSVLQMVNHGLSTGALFLLVGMLYERTHTRDLGLMGGLGVTVPVLAGVFLFVALSSMGLPGLNGFVGEFLILLGTFIVNKVYAVIAVTAVVLAAVYMLWAYQRAMHGTVRVEEYRRMPDLSLREYLILAPILAGILFIGVYPKPLLSRIEPATSAVCQGVIIRNPDFPTGGRISLPAEFRQRLDRCRSSAAVTQAATGGTSP